MNLQNYPDDPGYRNTDTSEAAAEDMKPSAKFIRQKVFEAIKAADVIGLTTEEIADRTGIEYRSVQPRTSELRVEGRIMDSGQRRKNATGKAAIVWVVKRG